jgi:hypothetical protein
MPDVECDNCGEMHHKKPSKIEDRENVFCSRECYHEFGRPDMRGENNPHHTGKVTLECEWCGDSFKVYPYRAEDARFCSSECDGKFKEGVTGKDHSKWKGGIPKHNCKNCGDTFWRYKTKGSDCNYCSKECYLQASEEIFAGDGNPAWRGGYYTYYGPNWDEQRQSALERDDYRCQDCGKHADEMDRSPDVHHKKRLGWFKEEYDAPECYERANKIENLVTLCPSCHMSREWDRDALS